jgi:hypothetical protein
MKPNGLRGEDVENILLAQNSDHLLAAVSRVVNVNDNELSSIKIGEFLDKLRDYDPVKKDCSAKLVR